MVKHSRRVVKPMRRWARLELFRERLLSFPREEIPSEPGERVVQLRRLHRLAEALRNPGASVGVPCRHSTMAVKPFLGGGLR